MGRAQPAQIQTFSGCVLKGSSQRPALVQGIRISVFRCRVIGACSAQQKTLGVWGDAMEYV
jgi:hypothetical protein